MQGQQREEPGNSPPRSPCRPAGTVPRQPPIRVPRPPFERRAPALWVCGRAFPRTVAHTRRRALGGSTGGSSGRVPGEGRLSALNPAALHPELRGDRRLSAASQCLRGEGRRGPRGDRHQPGWGRGRSSGALSWASARVGGEADQVPDPQPWFPRGALSCSSCRGHRHAPKHARTRSLHVWLGTRPLPHPALGGFGKALRGVAGRGAERGFPHPATAW